MTLTLDGGDGDGYLGLLITSDVAVAAGDLSVVAIDANGSHDVRGIETVALQAGIARAVYDYEFAQGDSVTYVVRTPDDLEQITIDVENPGTWITFPFQPGWSLKLPPATTLNDDLSTDTGFIDIVGSRFPVITGARLGGRDGTVSFAVDDFQQAAQIVAGLTAARVAMLRIPDPVEASRYIGIDRASYYKIEERTTRWMVTITYREVSRPLGQIKTPTGTMTFGEILALGESYSELLQRWPTFSDWGYLT